MPYTIQQLANLAGVSTRTLRYYDKIGLLPAQRNPDNGYRTYTTAQVDRLQRILFLRLFDMPLAKIHQLLNAPLASQHKALAAQRQRILQERQRLDNLLSTLDQTLKEGGNPMSDTDKFSAFKTNALQTNETQYGQELRDKYGDTTVTQANAKFAGLTPQDYEAMQQTEQALLTALKTVIANKTIASPEAKQVFNLHRQWLQYTLPAYSAEIHQGLAQMYTADPRFSQYYADKTGSSNAAAVLAAIIKHYAQS
ncbi:MerR family transcriptional regulator [Agrilactobacillus composti]|nr:MerR family transcriptional regulator [Agrilactobacillus composti]